MIAFPFLKNRYYHLMIIAYRTLILVLMITGLLACGGKEEKKKPAESKPISLIDQLNEEVARDKKNPDAYYKRAGYYYGKAEYDKALSDINRALGFDSANADYYLLKGDIYFGKADLKESIVSFEKALKIEPENVQAYLKLAEYSLIFRNYKKTFEYLDKVLKLDDINAKAYFLRGVAHLDNGDTASAIRNMQAAIDIDQKYYEANMQLGLVYSKKKNKLALDYFNNALNIKPDDPDATYAIGMFYQEKGDYEKAMNAYTKITSKYQKFKWAHYNLGYINLVFIKDFEKATKYFTDAIVSDSSYTDAWYNRGYSYELMGDKANAKDDYRHALDIDATHDKALKGLQRVSGR